VTQSFTVFKATATVTLGSLSANYNGSPHSATATTSPGGLAVTFTYAGSATAPTNAGSYAVVGTISNANYQGSASGTLVIAKAVPVITWPAPAAITYPRALSATQLNATASVPGDFTYVPAAGTVLGAGTQTLHVTFTPTDATDYTTPTATQTLTVNKATPVITWPAPAAITYPRALSATQLNATASVPGAFVYSPAVGTVLSGGAHTLHATFTPTDTANFTTAAATQVLTVNKALPVITWPAPAPITYGTALSAAQLNATASVPGALVYSPAAGTVLGAGAHTLHVTFTPTDAADYATVLATQVVTVNKAVPVITWPAPAPIPYGTALSATQLDATANVPGVFTYSPAVGAVLGGGGHTVHVYFTPTDTTDYTSANTTQVVTISKAVPVITWPAPAPITYGTALSATQLNATASVPGVLTYVPAAGTVLKGGTQTLKVYFAPTESTDYAGATATATLIVNKAVPVITWAVPAPITYGTALSATQLNARSGVTGTFVYAPAAGAVLSGGAHTLHVTLTPNNTTNYTTATATQVVTVTKAVPVITWPAPAPIIYGTALSATQLNATAAVPGSFVYSPAAGTVLKVGTQTLKTYFTPTDRTNYASATATRTLTVNPASSQAFLQKLFQDVLGREIDPGELNSFSAALAAGESRAEVLGDLLGSAEYSRRQIEPAIRLYYAALGQSLDYTDLQNWSDALHAGALTLAEAADQLAGSTEFLQHYGALDNTQYVQQLYRNMLGREADSASLAGWVGQLDAGASRGTVLAGLSESDEFKGNIADQVEILRLHFLLLQRMPTTAELQSWQDFLLGCDQTDNIAPAESGLAYLTNYFATLDDQMRDDLLAPTGL
jgi:predicted TIM-barrel enzyme